MKIQKVNVLGNIKAENVKMGFFCQHKMMEVELTLDVSLESIESNGKTAQEKKKILRRKCSHQEESCGGCKEIQRINAKVEFFDI